MFVISLNCQNCFRRSDLHRAEIKYLNIFAIKDVSPCVRGIKSTREEMMR